MASKWLASFRQAGDGCFDVSSRAEMSKTPKKTFLAILAFWHGQKRKTITLIHCSPIQIEGVSQRHMIARSSASAPPFGNRSSPTPATSCETSADKRRRSAGLRPTSSAHTQHIRSSASIALG